MYPEKSFFIKEINMFTLLKDLFFDPKTGLPWVVSVWASWFKPMQNNPLEPPANPIKLPKIQTSVTLRSSKPTVKKPAKKSEPKQTTAKVVSTKNKTTAKTVVKPATKTPAKTTSKSNVKPTTKTVKKVVAKPASTKITTAPKTVKKLVKTETAKKVSVKPVTSKKTETKKLPIVKKVELPATPTLKKEVKKEPLIVAGKLTRTAQNLITQISPSSSKEQIREAILLLCRTQEWTDVETLAKKTNHKVESLETLHLIPMVNNQQLQLRFPDDLHHKEQAYKIVK